MKTNNSKYLQTASERKRRRRYKTIAHFALNALIFLVCSLILFGNMTPLTDTIIQMALIIITPLTALVLTLSE